jgi:PAS domain S-box-containing protein
MSSDADSTDQLRTIIDGLPTMLWSAWPDGSIEFLNRRWLDYTGLSADAAQGWDWMAVVHPDDRTAARDFWLGVVRSGEPGETELRLRAADGAYRWFLVRSSASRDASGAVVRWYGTNTDIEDRHRAEDAVRASEQHLRSVLDTLPGLAFVIDSMGRIELLNRSVLEYFGASFEELRDRPQSEIVHPDDIAPAAARWQRAFETGETHDVALRMRRADGVYRWFQSQSVPLRDGAGRVVRWATLLTDIEEMQRVTEALQESEQRLRAVIDGIPAFIYTMAPTGEPEFFNRPFLDYLGRTAAEMMDWARIGVIHPDDLARSIAIWQRAIETGEDYSLEFRLRRADGVFRWFELRSRAVRDAGGRLVRSYAIVADIHDRKRAQRRLHRAMRARYQAVLVERSRIAQELHDTLLQGFTGITIQLRAIQRVLRRRPDEGAAALETALSAADTALRDARNSIWDMRAAELEGHDLPEALDGAVRSVVAGSSVALEFIVRGERRPLPPLVETTALRIGREAVLNALKHADAHKVDVHLEYGAQFLRLQVRDDGHGMTPHTPPAAANDGHFGIAGMRERAHRAGGTIEIASEPGRGLTVRASLPTNS